MSLRLLNKYIYRLILEARCRSERTLRLHHFIAISALIAFVLVEGSAFAGGFVIDPGHGGYESGIIAQGVKEKDAVLALARRIESVAREGRVVILSRTADAYISIMERRGIIHQAPVPKVFVSLHMTLSDSFVIYTASYPAGIEKSSPESLFSVYSRQIEHQAESRRLAHLIADRTQGAFNSGSILREMTATLLGAVSAPAVIIEIPARLLKNEEKFDDIARMILNAVEEFEKNSGAGR